MAEDLLELTRQLVAVRSESFSEQDIVALIERRLRTHDHLEVTRVGDNLIARTELSRAGRVVLAGHTDTVPSTGNEIPRVSGDNLWGLGSTDMKGGLAVMLALAEAHVDPPVDLSFVFYAREEVAAKHNGLLEIAEKRGELLQGDVAVLGEPTGGDVEAGCQGVLRLNVTLRGSRAHTARAWMGRNAIHRLGPLLDALTAYTPRRPVIAGCEFHEALMAVTVEGGVAGNVVPDEVTVQVAHRFAPDRTSAEAVEFVMDVLSPFLEDEDTCDVLDLSEAAFPGTDHPFVSGMIERRNLSVGAKLGWTDVARFGALGIPAINLGPGDATLAHTPEESVERHTIDRSFAALSEAISIGF